jgi:hypothetical protein
MSDYESVMRDALREVTGGLRPMIGHYESKTVETSPKNLSRWIGFVQGVLAAMGRLDVSEERDRTRPIFHTAYHRLGIEPPASASMGK